MKFPRKFSFVAMLVVLASMTACGGGGGGTTATATATTTTTLPTITVPVPVATAVASTIVTTAPAATYAAGSEELLAFNLLNAERVSCGFGALAQNTNLDAAAKAHADYQILNQVASHLEDATAYPIGFTGVQPVDRANVKGYTGAGDVGDEFSIAGTSIKTGLGVLQVRGLLNSPYHLKGLVSGYRDVGVSMRSNTDVGTGTTAVFLQIDSGYKTAAGQQLQGSTDVNTYPCDGSTGINRKLTSETPNPIPGRDLNASPVGSSVYIQVRDGNVLTINSATMTQVSNGLPVTLRTPVTSANDPYAPCTSGCYKANQAYIVADAPMQANTSFQVNITGTNNGTAFSRSFNFTTGSGG